MLIIGLWILVILTILAVAVGHKVSMTLRLSNYQRGKLKAYALAKAGINRAILELVEDRNEYDAPDEKWADNEGVFKKIVLKEGMSEEGPDEFATVSYDTIDENHEAGIVYGIMDEERKIDINIALPEVLAALLKECKVSKFDDIQADELVNYIRVWRGDTGIDENNEKYKNFKKALFSNPEELMIVLEYFFEKNNPEDYQNKAQAVFNEIKDLITVWGMQVNANTASGAVLTILLNSIATDEEISYVADAVKEIEKERGSKYFEKIDDIGQEVSGDIPYVNLFNKLKTKQPLLVNVNSNYFKIESRGNAGKITKRISVVFDRQDTNKKIVYWHEN